MDEGQRHYEQQGNISDMLFPVSEMLACFSRHMRMVPGDIPATGTPPGVGMGKNRFMAVGDILECGITNLGAQRHEIVACFPPFRGIGRTCAYWKSRLRCCSFG
jgi:2-keto-4-pentenoate hydratase/2-oxohepta-3-ene-1,7-dioic acid hydratase in catechol pathway